MLNHKNMTGFGHSPAAEKKDRRISTKHPARDILAGGMLFFFLS
jgi:hypothetical protein